MYVPHSKHGTGHFIGADATPREVGDLSGMRLHFLLLAQAASAPPDGLLYIHGGGINTVLTQQVPLGFQGTLVIRLFADRSEAGRQVPLEIQINDEDGRSILPQPVRLLIAAQPVAHHPVGWPIPVQVVANLTGVQLARAGEYTIDVLLNDQHVGSEHLRVVVGAPGQAPAAPPPEPV